MKKHALAFLKYALSIVAYSGIGMVNWWDADPDSLKVGVVTSSERERARELSQSRSSGMQPASGSACKNPVRKVAG